MSEKVKCHYCDGRGFLDLETDRCPVCHGTGFAPALSDEGIRETLLQMLNKVLFECSTCDYAIGCPKHEDEYCRYEKELVDQILALTASHYTEKIKELEGFIEDYKARLQYGEEYINTLVKRSTELSERVNEIVHQAEQETARRMIDDVKTELNVYMELKREYAPYLWAWIDSLESKYGMSK